MADDQGQGQDQAQGHPQGHPQGQAQGQDRQNKGVFWDLGLAIKETDPTDPTGKKMRAICKCLNDRDNPDSVCNKHIGKFVITRMFCNITCNFSIIQMFCNITCNFCIIRMFCNITCKFCIIRMLNVISVLFQL